jgi:glutathione S-transferase
VLVRDGGAPIYDSRVITRYLDDLWSAGLYPAADLWDVLTREAAAEGILDSSVAMSYETRLRPEDKVWDGWLDAHWSKIARMLDQIEAGEPDGPIDMARIALACALGHIDFRHAVRDWRAGRPKLAAWYDAFAQRPSMQATKPA